MPFSTIRTERLLVRSMEADDVDFVLELRSHPDVARYQDWELPYTREDAEAAVERCRSGDWVADKTGTNLVVVDADDPTRRLGDVHASFRWDGRTGYVGYSFLPQQWGQGYACEATEAVVRYLFETWGVSRIESSLHPHNPASARVLERCGFVFEGQTRQSFWVGDECSDDALYGLLRSEWDELIARPRHRPEAVALVPVTYENDRTVEKLETHHSQKQMVASVTESFADALFPPANNGVPRVPWLRAIEADGEAVGFVMATGATAEQSTAYLWRLLIDRRHQRRGIASMALDEFEAQFRADGASAIEVSWVEGVGSPRPFYEGRGYVPNGRVEDGETYAVKRFEAE